MKRAAVFLLKARLYTVGFLERNSIHYIRKETVLINGVYLTGAGIVSSFKHIFLEGNILKIYIEAVAYFSLLAV